MGRDELGEIPVDRAVPARDPDADTVAAHRRGFPSAAITHIDRASGR
jgi:hypothetical protein